MKHYNAHNDCLVYLQRHSVTTIPTSSLRCKVLGIFRVLKTNWFLTHVTVLLQSWWSVPSRSSVVYLKIHVISTLLLGRATENTLCVRLESLNTCSDDSAATKDWTCFPSLPRFSAHTYLKIKMTYIFVMLTEWQIQSFTLGWSLNQN